MCSKVSVMVAMAVNWSWSRRKSLSASSWVSGVGVVGISGSFRPNGMISPVTRGLADAVAAGPAVAVSAVEQRGHIRAVAVVADPSVGVGGEGLAAVDVGQFWDVLVAVGRSPQVEDPFDGAGSVGRVGHGQVPFGVVLRRISRSDSAMSSSAITIAW